VRGSRSGNKTNWTNDITDRDKENLEFVQHREESTELRQITHFE